MLINFVSRKNSDVVFRDVCLTYAWLVRARGKPLQD